MSAHRHPSVRAEEPATGRARTQQRPRAPLTIWLPMLWGAVALAIIYLPCLQGDFIWDDQAWTTHLEPLHRDLSGLWQMWSNPVAMQQYFPLTGTSFWLDWHLWQEWTLPYHVENVILHGLAAALFWLTLRHLKLEGAGLAAMCFALHPMMVESVAWITERKNVLSMVLMLASLLAWFRFEAGHSPQRRCAWHLLALLFFAASLLAKITSFILPPTLLLLAWWRHGGLNWRRHALPVLPFFALSLSLGMLITWLERHHVGAEGADFDMSLTERLLLAGRAFWFYPKQLLWPAETFLFYPKWKIQADEAVAWLFPLSGFLLFAILWLGRARVGRGALVAAGVYTGAILPVLGFLNVYGMFLADVADRWVYVPSLPLLALAANTLVTWRKRLDPEDFFTWLPWVLPALLIVPAWRHAAAYAKEETFWRTALSQNPEAWVAHNNLGGVLIRERRQEEAMQHLERALALRPDYPEAHNNRGNLLRDLGRMDEAVAEYREALRLRPDSFPDAFNNLGLAQQSLGLLTEARDSFQRAVEIQPSFALAHNNLGNALLHEGRVEEAVSTYRKALQIQPNYPDACNNLGMALIRQGKNGEALAYLQRAADLRPDYVEALNNLGHALLQSNRLAEAEERFRQALRARPAYAQAHHNLALTLFILGRIRESIAEYEQAVASDPNQAGSLNNLAWILSTHPDDALRNGKRAVAAAEKANALTGGQDAVVLHTLAAAYAEAGRYESAGTTARQALERATAENNPTLAGAIREQLSHYESSRPYRDSEPDEP